METPDQCAFAREEDAVAALCGALAPHFNLFREIEVAVDGRLCRIDCIACDPTTKWVLGFEVKRGFFQPAEYATALKQAADYRAAVIVDPALPLLKGKRLAATLIFPNWIAGAAPRKAGRYTEMARGMELLAAKFKVGTAEITLAHGLFLTMAQGRLWSTSMGWGHNAENVLFGKRQIAAQRDYEAGLARG